MGAGAGCPFVDPEHLGRNGDGDFCGLLAADTVDPDRADQGINGRLVEALDYYADEGV